MGPWFPFSYVFMMGELAFTEWCEGYLRELAILYEFISVGNSGISGIPPAVV
jgi:hypothetical protein